MSAKKKRQGAKADGGAGAAAKAAAPAPPPAPAGPADEAALRARTRRFGWYVLVAAVLTAALLSFLSIQRYRDFYGGRYDLGNMVQAVYNTAHGRFLQITDASGQQVSRLGSHVDPILAVFALPWLAWPSPLMLLVVQAVIVAASAWPAYRLGVRWLKDPQAAFLMTLALLLYPPLQYAVLNEFHPVTLALPLLLFGFLYLEEHRTWRAVPFLVLAALCKEEIPLVIAMMGAYFALRRRSWKPLIVTAVAAVYFVVAVKLVLPHYSPAGNPILDRYSDYGSSPGKIAANVFLKPGQTLGDVFSWSNVHYWLQLLWPFGFASLLSPLTLLIAAPELLLNAIAGQDFQRSIEFHYVAGETPFVYAAAVLGLVRAQRLLGRRGERTRLSARRRVVPRFTLASMAGVVLAVCVVANYVMGPLPLSLPGSHSKGKDYAVSSHAKALDLAIKMIPKGDSVSVTTENDAGSHLSARHTVYSFPYIDHADWVIVDNGNAYVFDQPDGKLHSQALGALVLNPDYTSVFARDNVYVFKKVAGQGGAAGKAPSGASPSPAASSLLPLPIVSPSR